MLTNGSYNDKFRFKLKGHRIKQTQRTFVVSVQRKEISQSHTSFFSTAGGSATIGSSNLGSSGGATLPS